MNMNNMTDPIDIEDDRVGNFYRNVRSREVHTVSRCFMWGKDRYLTIEKVVNPKGIKSTISFCGSDEKFWLNFEEPFYCNGEVAQR